MITVSTKKSGFTLIELLVVIAIIAILAAILFPVFAKVREKARQTSCLSNLKQLGLAFQQYTQDYDEKYQQGNGGTVASTQGQGWVGPMYSYIKSAGMLKCPSDSTTATTTSNTGNKALNVPLSYAYNSNLPGISSAALQSPVRTVLCFEVQGATAGVTDTAEIDSPSGNGVNGLNYPGGTNVAQSPTTSYATPALYATDKLGGTAAPTTSTTVNGGLIASGSVHSGGANYLLTDGHAKWFRGSAVSPGYNATAANTNQVFVLGTPTSSYAASTDWNNTPAFGATYSYQ